MKERLNTTQSVVPKITVYSLKMAGYLMLNSCPLLGLERNRKAPFLKVFFFRDTPEAQNLIKQWTDVNR